MIQFWETSHQEARVLLCLEKRNICQNDKIKRTISELCDKFNAWQLTVDFLSEVKSLYV